MEKQLSGPMLESLRNIIIEGDSQSIALFRLSLEAILALGDKEHTGDWDPYLSIHLKPHHQIQFMGGDSNPEALSRAINSHGLLETCTGYPEILFGDFNELENSNPKYWMRHTDEITDIIVSIANPDNEEQPLEIIIPISNISLISVER